MDGLMDIIQKAFDYAYEKHKMQYRKRKGVPYIVHLLDVASILLKNNASKELVAAGLLHDIVEDNEYTHVKEDDLRLIFGNKITDLVMAVSEDPMLPEYKKLLWKERKKEIIEKLKKSSVEVKMLKCADALSNLHDDYNYYLELGVKINEHLKREKHKDLVWYYSEILENLSEVKDSYMYGEYVQAMRVFEKL